MAAAVPLLKKIKSAQGKHPAWDRCTCPVDACEVLRKRNGKGQATLAVAGAAGPAYEAGKALAAPPKQHTARESTQQLFHFMLCGRACLQEGEAPGEIGEVPC